MGMKTRLAVLMGLVLCLGKCFLVFRVGVLQFVTDILLVFFIFRRHLPSRQQLRCRLLDTVSFDTSHFRYKNGIKCVLVFANESTMGGG